MKKYLKKNSGGTRNKRWKPTGKHVVRLLKFEDGDAAKPIGFHYNIGGNKPIVCPKYNFGDDCAICDACESLKSWNDENGIEKPEGRRKQEFKFFTKIQVKERWYTPLILREGDDKSPKLWDYTPAVLKKIIKCAETLNEEYSTKEFSILNDVEEAMDLVVEFKDKNDNNQFTSTEVSYRTRTSKLADNQEEIDQILENLPDLFSFVEKQSSDEVEKLWADFLDSKDSGSDTSSGTEYTHNSAETPVVNTRDLDEVFEEIAG